MIHVPFIDRTNDRALPADYSGDVVVFDIDKTYLDTHFSSLGGLLKIPLEFAVDKETVPGAVALLRGLRRGAGAKNAQVPIFFVSGSPRELRRVVERKMTLDGVEFDGITFKDQLGLARALRFKDIRSQVGYKTLALLSYRSEVPVGGRWLLFGDDVESDARVFTLFGDILAGLRGGELDRELARLGVPKDQRALAVELASPLPVRELVDFAFIHLATGRPPESLPGRHTIATRSFLQTAMVLAAHGRVRGETISAVANELRRRGVDPATIEAHVRDAERRLGVPTELLALAGR